MTRDLRVLSRLLVGVVLATGATLMPPSFSLFAQPAPAFAADDGCKPGVMASIPGPPSALETLQAVPGDLKPTGAGVTVAIVDSGVDATRPQLGQAFAPGSRSLVTDGERPDGLSDPHGHGTAIAGIIAARPAESSGVVGVAPNATIVSVRVFRGEDEESKKSGFGPDSERLAAGIRTAVDLGARVIAVAMSDDVESSTLRDATAYAADHGSLVVASAGNRATASNTSDSPRYPAAYPGALSVTAVSDTGLPTDDSIHGDHIDVAAPGQKVLTTATGAGDCMYAIEAPSASFATAYAAGSAALLAEAYPQEGPEGWTYRLEATAVRPNPDARDDHIGWGTIRPAAALSLRPDRSTRGPKSPFADVSDSAVSRPTLKLPPGTAQEKDPAAVIAIAIALGGAVVLLALIAQLRRQRELSGDPDPHQRS